MPTTFSTIQSVSYTPWGHAQSCKEIAPGILLYETASHGGMQLSSERVAAMPPILRDIEPFAGPGWYEEDCDLGLVMLAFPECFSDREVSAAVDMYSEGQWHPSAASFLASPDATALKERCLRYEREGSPSL